MKLSDLVNEISEFGGWNHAEKITFFAWFLHSQRKLDRVTPADVRGCYTELHLEQPTNIGPYLASLENRKPKAAVKDGRGYYLVAHVRNDCEGKFAPKAVDSIPKTEQVLSQSVVIGTRGYLEAVVQQANGCYEHNWFDSCSVMIRKFVEILIIEVYEAHHKASDIKNSNDDFFMLGDLVSSILKDTAWNLARETKRVLPEIKSLGDRSAHNRRYIAKKSDVDKVIPGLRVAADDLLHLAKLK